MQVCYDCRNDIDNCKIERTDDEIDYISYIRKNTSLFDKSVSEFLNSRVIAEEIDVKFNKGMMKIDPNDRVREAKINDLELKPQEVCNAVELIKMQETKSKKRESIKPNLSGRELFYPRCWFSLDNSETVKAVTLTFCSVE